MPYLQINNTQIYYEDQGNGPETIIFSHGLLWSGYLFHNQIAILKNRYRCITFDFRGQGQSEVSQSGYDVESLYQDAVSIIETLDIGPCHFIGLSMGGFVGLRLAIRRSDLLKSLVILNSSPDPESKADERRYKMLSFVARWFGLGIVANRVMEIMFGKKFLKDPMRTDLKRDWKERMVTNDRIGITRAVSGVITREGVSDRLNQIGITNSELVIIPGAGHTSTIEEPEAVTAVLEKFLNIQKG
jgi:pimeloyl-ACP methyl ester carboxylesterase